MNVLGEFGQTLLNLANPKMAQYTQELKGMVNRLYELSGKGLSLPARILGKKENRLPAIDSPAYSFIGEATPETMHDALRYGLSAEDGLMSRLLIFESRYYSERPNTNPNATMPDGLRAAIYNLASIAGKEHGLLGGKTVYQTGVNVPFTGEAKMLENNLLMQYRDKVTAGRDSPLLLSMYNRAHLKVIKIAASMAVFDNPENPLITLEHVQWADAVVSRSIAQYEHLFKAGAFDVSDTACEKAVIEKIRHFMLHPERQKGYSKNLSCGIISHECLRNAIKGLAPFAKHPNKGLQRALDDAIKGVIDSGYLKPDTVDGKKSYYVVKLPD